MKLFAERRGIALSTLSRHVGSPSMAARLAEGRVTIATAQRVTQWLSDHWPDDLDWPTDIPRPAPRSEDEAA
ncbi:MAG: hypothetical protein OXQ28_05545 [Acidobacteriota bacterium]|nr:hypothetical protein [Acidobacteriota bacterium]